MSAWLKPLLVLVVLTALVAGVIALDYFGIVQLKGLTPASSPEFDRFKADLPLIGLAFLFGALGAFVRLNPSDGKFFSRLRRLVVGGIIGVIVFFVLKSEVIPQLIYDNLDPKNLEVSYYGLALLSVFGGMYAGELTRWASGGR